MNILQVQRHPGRGGGGGAGGGGDRRVGAERDPEGEVAPRCTMLQQGREAHVTSTKHLPIFYSPSLPYVNNKYPRLPRGTLCGRHMCVPRQEPRGLRALPKVLRLRISSLDAAGSDGGKHRDLVNHVNSQKTGKFTNTYLMRTFTFIASSS